MIITISGKPGSGKTTAAKMVAKSLGYKFFSAGDFRGQIALEKGLTIDQLNHLGKKDIWTDKIVDDELEKIGKTQDNIVVDGWLGFYFIPQSVKVFLDIDLDEAAKRIFENPRPDEEIKKDYKEVKKMIEKRLKETAKRYKLHYNLDYFDLSPYDLVIETTNMKEGDSAKAILKFLKSKKL
jgi:CMP/dCMP kinase